MPIKPSGTKAPARSERSVTTPGASIQFSTPIGQTSVTDVPALIMNARHIKDAAPKDLSLTSTQLSAVTDLDTLESVVYRAYETNSDYLEASEVEGKNDYLGTAGSRKLAFFGSISENLAGTPLPIEDYPAARRLLKKIEEETYMGRTLEFDTAKLDTYHPYSEPFDEGVRKLQALAPEGIERDNITHEIDYITDRKTQYGWGPMFNERDAESTLGLRAIDRGNQNQAISLARDSQNPQRPSYVVINVNPDGLPEGQGKHAGEAVFRDGESLYFDKTDKAVPAALAAHLTEKSASDKLGLRTFENDEDPRSGFPYDWNQNQSIDVDTINTSWWGHCHIEAPLAALSVHAGSDVTVFDARSKAVKTFGDTDVNDLLFAMLDATNYADINTSQGANAGKTTFVGNRNDTTGGSRPEYKLILEVDGDEHPFSLHVRDLFKDKGSEERVDRHAIFSPTIVGDDRLHFSKNPAFLGLRDSDWSTINGERKISAEVEYLDVSASGTVEKQLTNITIDPANPSTKPLLLGSTLDNSSYPPNVTKYYLNETTGQLESKTFTPEKQADGTYKTVATSEEATVVGDVTGRVLSKELVKESIIELHEHVLNAARRGVSFVTDESSGNMVWNYGTNAMTLSKRDHDGDFSAYRISLETQGGTKEWNYLLQVDQDGIPIAAHALGEPADFVWRPERQVSAPLYRGDDGKLLFNTSAYKRGFLLDSDGKLSPEGMSFFRYASDVIYASLADPKKDERYVVIDADGDLYFYDDLEAFNADVIALGGDANSVRTPSESDGAATGGVRTAPTREVDPPRDNGETVPAIFRALIDHTNEGDVALVVGNTPELGNWDPQRGFALRSGEYLFPYWVGDLDLPTDETVEYKWVILRADGTVEWEDGPNRTLTTLSFGPPSVTNGYFDAEDIGWRHPAA